MFTAWFRAFAQLLDPRIVRVLGFSVLLSLAIFAGLWVAMAWMLEATAVTEWALVDRIVDVLGGVGTIVATYFLFPVVVSALIGLWLESVARAVELRHYPTRTPKGIGLVAGALASVRFLVKALLINVALLVFLLFPVAYPFAWLVANAWLLSQEYFELVALRHLAPHAARAIRKQHRLHLFLAGLAAAGLFAVPVVNLIAPVVTTMAMVHLFERLRPAA